MFLILFFCLLLIGGFVYIFPEFYISELVLSFLPYLLFAYFIIFVYSFSIRKKIVKLFMVFCSLFLLFLYWYNFFSFYSLNSEKFEKSGWVKVFYSNLLWTNKNYSEINNIINEEDPDVLMFVEFADHHFESMKKVLSEKYPFVNRTTWSKDLMVWSVVFSKYPIDNLSEEFPQWAWRYGYFSLNYEGQLFYFYLVHTSSPVSSRYFQMRNVQIKNLMNDFEKQKLQRKNSNVILVGDFNITPWSAFYDNLENGLWYGFKNYSSEGVRFTWHTPKLWFFWAHIDHVFASNSIFLKVDKTIKVGGSDHRGYIFYVYWE